MKMDITVYGLHHAKEVVSYTEAWIIKLDKQTDRTDPSLLRKSGNPRSNQESVLLKRVCMWKATPNKVINQRIAL